MAAEMPAQDKLTKLALSKLEKHLNVSFSIPFPKHYDIDAHSKQPIALLLIDDAKISVTQPMMNPHDGAGTIEWMMGPEDLTHLLKDDFSCILYLDEDGHFFQIGLPWNPDAWTSEGREGHQLRRRKGELGSEFFTRAMLTYRLRAQKAKAPAQAMRYLAAFEKIAVAIQQLRQGEKNPVSQ